MSSSSMRPWAVGLAVAAATGAGFALIWGWAIGLQSYNVWGALLVTPVFVAVNAVLLWRASRARGSAN